MADDLRSRTIKLAAELPKGSLDRKALLTVLASTPSPAAVKMLKVMAAGGGKTSQLNINLLNEVLGLIGWDITETVAATKLSSDEQLEKLLAGFLRTHAAQAWGYPGAKEPKEFWVPTEHAAQELAKDLLRLPNVSKVSKNGPSSVQPGHLYVSEVEVYERHNNTWAVKTMFWWVGATAWEISSGSARAIVALRIDDRGRWDDPASMKIPSFWTWGYKNGLREAAQAFLVSMGDEAVERATRPPSARSLENTGTCPCCFTNVKLHNGTIMRHGWAVQGQRTWGSYGNTWHSGSCYGVGYKPFELSSKGTEAYKAVVEKSLESANKRQREHALYPDELSFMQGRQLVKVEKPVDFVPSGDGSTRYLRRGQYGHIHGRMSAQIAADIREFENLARTLEAQVTGWSLKTLPGER